MKSQSPTGLRVLLVEDDPADAVLVCEMLADPLVDRVRIEHVSSLGALAATMAAVTDPAAADTPRPDVVLLDLSLPESRGLATLARAARLVDGLPIVVLTGSMDDVLGLGAIERGAQDYLRKDQLDGPLLARALHFAIERSRSRALLQSVLHSQSDGVLVVDASGRVVLHNPAAAALLGGRVADWPDALTRDPDEAHALARAAREGQTWARTVDGPSAAHVDVRVDPLGGPDGGGVVVMRDVTATVERRRRIERLNDALQRHLEQKTALLARLETADALRSRFLDAVSHELRTPLTPIRGFSDLLLRDRRDPLSAQQATAVAAIRDSAGRLERIVESMLDFQALQRTAEPAEPRPVDVRRLLERLADEARQRVGRRPVRVEAATDGALPERVLLDEHRLTDALLRLVDNAARFTREGRIELRAAWRDSALECAVVDTGIGIPPQHVESIFGAFYQVDPGLSGSRGGIGLGLAHARALVRSMRGDINVESTPGRGSRFVARVPVQAEH